MHATIRILSYTKYATLHHYSTVQKNGHVISCYSMLSSIIEHGMPVFSPGTPRECVCGNKFLCTQHLPHLFLQPSLEFLESLINHVSHI